VLIDFSTKNAESIGKLIDYLIKNIMNDGCHRLKQICYSMDL